MFWLIIFFYTTGSHSKDLCTEKILNLQFEQNYRTVYILSQNGTQHYTLNSEGAKSRCDPTSDTASKLFFNEDVALLQLT